MLTFLVFLVGGTGVNRQEPLSYSALARLSLAHVSAPIRELWMTPHALRHPCDAHVEAGMRELTLQKRLTGLPGIRPEFTQGYPTP